MCGTAQLTPGVLVATRAMQQIEHGIAAALVVAGRGVDGHAALHLQRGAGVPHLREVAVGNFVDAIEVTLVALLVTNNKDVGERHDVAVNIDVGRVLDTCHTIDVEGIAVHLRSKLLGGIAPHAVLAFHEFSHTWGIVLAVAGNVDRLRGQEIASHLDLYGLGGIEVKSYGAVRVDDGRLYAGTVEEFLLCRGSETNHCQSHHKNRFSHSHFRIRYCFRFIVSKGLVSHSVSSRCSPSWSTLSP